MALEDWTKKMAEWLARKAPETLEVDDVGVRRRRGDEVFESVTWDDLQTVSVLTTSDGPWGEDFYWMLLGSVSGCAIGGELAQGTDLLARLQALPGFDNHAVIRASGCTEEAAFDCWSRAGTTDDELAPAA